jgi:hypothetical protein
MLIPRTCVRDHHEHIESWLTQLFALLNFAPNISSSSWNDLRLEVVLHICAPYHESRPPLWSSGQNSWLQIQSSGFGSRRYQIFWEVVELERDPLSLASTIEELLGRKSKVFGLESREYGRRWSAALTTRHPLSAKIGTNFADKRRSRGW